MSDLISREKLRKAMYHEAFETDSDFQKWDGGCWIRYKLFENVLENIPSAEKTGKWIWAGDRYYCSECRQDVYGNTVEVLIGLWHYCPHCGTRMVNDEH